MTEKQPTWKAVLYVIIAMLTLPVILVLLYLGPIFYIDPWNNNALTSVEKFFSSPLFSLVSAMVATFFVTTWLVYSISTKENRVKVAIKVFLGMYIYLFLSILGFGYIMNII